MKLQELAVPSQTKQAAKVFESYFGNRIAFDSITTKQARNLLTRVRGLVNEHRRTPAFHSSEQNPNYLKLVMLEQALTARIKEDGMAMPAPMQGAVGTAGASQQATDPAKAAALQTAQVQQKKRTEQEQLKQLDDQIKALQAQRAQVQKSASMPTMETRRSRRLREASEVQQAQVVLASQDMVDQVQKMIEQVTSMQFKDLPALVDQIKNQVGLDQSAQFNTDATAALAGLVQNLQASKQQLETALGVVTGQAPVVPGEDTMASTDMNANLPMDGEELPSELPAPDEEELPAPSASLGRGRR
jgi:hypothetical protein